jgi:hypothetical protein
MQMADTTLFGPFKSFRDVIEAQFKLMNKGVKVGRVEKVKIAGLAMIQAFTKARIISCLSSSLPADAGQFHR